MPKSKLRGDGCLIVIGTEGNRAVGDDMIRGKVFGQRIDARDETVSGAGVQRRRPDAATLGSTRPRARPTAEPTAPASPPDAASFGRGGGIVPDVMTWVRSKKPRR